MKIIYYSPHPYLNLSSPSGYGTHMREMINSFEKLGHEVVPVIAGGVEQPKQHLTSTSPKRKLIDFFKKITPGYIWESLKDHRLQKFDATMIEKLKKVVEEEKPDLIYERGNYLQVSGLEVSRPLNIKHFIELNAPYVKERVELQGSSSFLKKATSVEKRLLTESDKIFVISSSLKEYFEKQVPELSNSQITAIPNAINLSKFIANDSLANSIKTKYSYSEDDKIIGFVGSILRWHGVDILIKAFHEIHDDFPAAKLLIVGSGEVFDELNEMTKSLNLDKKVVFTGNVPHHEVPSYIDVMDITVIAKTNWYCSPIKIFEYAALGKAIVASNHPPVVEVMNDREHGLIVDSNPSSVAEALRELLSDDELRGMVAKNFKEKTINEHTWDSNAKKVLSFF